MAIYKGTVKVAGATMNNSTITPVQTSGNLVATVLQNGQNFNLMTGPVGSGEGGGCLIDPSKIDGFVGLAEVENNSVTKTLSYDSVVTIVCKEPSDTTSTACKLSVKSNDEFQTIAVVRNKFIKFGSGMTSDFYTGVMTGPGSFFIKSGSTIKIEGTGLYSIAPLTAISGGSVGVGGSGAVFYDWDKIEDETWCHVTIGTTEYVVQNDSMLVLGTGVVNNLMINNKRIGIATGYHIPWFTYASHYDGSTSGGRVFYLNAGDVLKTTTNTIEVNIVPIKSYGSNASSGGNLIDLTVDDPVVLEANTAYGPLAHNYMLNEAASGQSVSKTIQISKNGVDWVDFGINYNGLPLYIKYGHYIKVPTNFFKLIPVS